MKFTQPRPRRVAESVVPMINVVFLLLIFFLMSAQIAPPDMGQVSPPEGPGENLPEAGDVLVVDASGRMTYGPLQGDAALAALEGGVILRADAALPAQDLARLLARLAAAGHGDLRLVTVTP
ncbi:ExbD/TolR family protein [Rhodovulum imhoffii]|nr:biopolymer transporter ExbD [Rhodovulum imhoffii]